MIDPEKIAEERYPDVRSNSSSETFEPVYPSEIVQIKRDAFADGMRHVLHMLYAEVKPEELVNGKVYLVAYAMLADWYPAVACGSARIEISGKKYYAKQFAYIRGPILQPSEVLDD